jgi:hypothetical protein
MLWQEEFLLTETAHSRGDLFRVFIANDALMNVLFTLGMP